mmetsp:Transcript_9704/g.28911  ORF Transcript_9704/g.28911 Transcript_9704/m.28911 type:complete len:431 (-) Transcript_9704:463-1755(-)
MPPRSFPGTRNPSATSRASWQRFSMKVFVFGALSRSLLFWLRWFGVVVDDEYCCCCCCVSASVFAFICFRFCCCGSLRWIRFAGTFVISFGQVIIDSDLGLISSMWPLQMSTLRIKPLGLVSEKPVDQSRSHMGFSCSSSRSSRMDVLSLLLLFPLLLFPLLLFTHRFQSGAAFPSFCSRWFFLQKAADDPAPSLGSICRYPGLSIEISASSSTLTLAYRSWSSCRSTSSSHWNRSYEARLRSMFVPLTRTTAVEICWSPLPLLPTLLRPRLSHRWVGFSSTVTITGYWPVTNRCRWWWFRCLRLFRMLLRNECAKASCAAEGERACANGCCGGCSGNDGPWGCCGDDDDDADDDDDDEEDWNCEDCWSVVGIVVRCRRRRRREKSVLLRERHVCSLEVVVVLLLMVLLLMVVVGCVMGMGDTTKASTVT